MNKQAADILQAFVEWLNYDRSQESFTLSSHDLHSCYAPFQLGSYCNTYTHDETYTKCNV